jgi:putative membrane protein insertion efficiency factor
MAPAATEVPPACVHPRRSPPARVLVALFTLYQLARSGHPSPCRFLPTCSNYAIEAVSRHGARRGLSLALRRLGRCRPGGPNGFDPVPE